MSPRPPHPPAAPSDVLRGTLDLLILKALSREPMHGWAIAQRLEDRGWVDSEWRATDQGRRAKYYELTPAGRRALGEEAASWHRYVAVVELILRTA